MCNSSNFCFGRYQDYFEKSYNYGSLPRTKSYNLIFLWLYSHRNALTLQSLRRPILVCNIFFCVFDIQSVRIGIYTNHKSLYLCSWLDLMTYGTSNLDNYCPFELQNDYVFNMDGVIVEYNKV